MSDRDAGEVRLLRWTDADSQEFARFTTAMTALQSRIRQTWGAAAGTPVPRAPDTPSERECIAAVLRHAQLRRTLAGSHAALFAAPAWSVLLATILLDGRAEDLTVTAGVDAAALSTALAALADAGLVRDGLATPEGLALVRAYIAQL